CTTRTTSAGCRTWRTPSRTPGARTSESWTTAATGAPRPWSTAVRRGRGVPPGPPRTSAGAGSWTWYSARGERIRTGKPGRPPSPPPTLLGEAFDAGRAAGGAAAGGDDLAEVRAAVQAMIRRAEEAARAFPADAA